MASSSKIYELAYSGQEVDEAIYKIQNLDLDNLNGIVVLESTQSSPYNLNFLRIPGIFMVKYVYGSSAPAGVADITPVYIYVSTYTATNGTVYLIQSMYAGDVTYTRKSADVGVTWDDWTTSGNYDFSELTREQTAAAWDQEFGG